MEMYLLVNFPWTDSPGCADQQQQEEEEEAFCLSVAGEKLRREIVHGSLLRRRGATRCCWLHSPGAVRGAETSISPQSWVVPKRLPPPPSSYTHTRTNRGGRGDSRCYPLENATADHLPPPCPVPPTDLMSSFTTSTKLLRGLLLFLLLSSSISNQICPIYSHYPSCEMIISDRSNTAGEKLGNQGKKERWKRQREIVGRCTMLAGHE
ncbi:hypothetical protein JOB18_014851 [Solea senegalensis]|uniref:Uncharacterized protein n=1 Tax=Solea senegalensis TaxID=28829 RepID=A0AAV6SF57_SOLSE|nr:hypothetical protein JOB18_014851 [Solea senegalensis]